MIVAERLTKRYGSTTAVDDVSFTVRPGLVTGFLGPNGAGKSTTMRMIVGLDAPSAGSVTVGGRRYAQSRTPLTEVGVLLDAKAVHTGRSARAHLRAMAATHGIPNSRVDEVIALTGLESVARRRAGKFSLGMGQRLGIAGALLGDPATLILDEPVNGLDPAGIRWMRSLLAGFAAQGGTVLLSSHLLLEMQEVSDDLIVIGGGKIVAQGSKEELLSVPGSVVASLDDVALATALERGGFEVSRHAGGGLATSAQPEQVGVVARDAAIALTNLSLAQNHGLEELFFNLTAETAREEVAA